MDFDKKNFIENFVSTHLANSVKIIRYGEKPEFNVNQATFLALLAWDAYLTSEGADIPPSKVEVEYEGMGTCINCDFKIDGKRHFSINAAMPEYNDETQTLIKLVTRALAIGIENGLGND